MLEIAVNNAIAVALLAVGVVLFRFVRSNPAVIHCLWVLLLVKLIVPTVSRRGPRGRHHHRREDDLVVANARRSHNVLHA